MRQLSLEAATEEAEQRQKRKSDYGAVTRRLVVQNNFAGAARVQAQRREESATEETGRAEQRQKQERAIQMQSLVYQADDAGAARLQEQMMEDQAAHKTALRRTRQIGGEIETAIAQRAHAVTAPNQEEQNDSLLVQHKRTRDLGSELWHNAHSGITQALRPSRSRSTPSRTSA